MPTIQFNFDYFPQLGALPFPQMMLQLFLDGGWIPVLIIMIVGFWNLFVQWRQNLYAATLKHVVLAIDVPRVNEQTAMAVEQIFAHLSGAYSGLDAFEKYWLGKFQPTFSFEIVSIEGYIQFLVRTPFKFRDLVESALYSQYPDAEIVEVTDYVDGIPSKFPDPEHDIFGTEFILAKPSHFPIRTHIQFEHSLSEEYFKDPLSGLLEVMGSLRRGEQVWLQWLITPTDDHWKVKGEEAVNKMVGKKIPPKKHWLDPVHEIPLAVLNEFGSAILSSSSEPKKPEKKDDTLRMLALTPGERSVVEAVQMKLSKIGLQTKARMIYFGRRDVFAKGRVLSAVKGALGQFSALNMNQLKSYGKVTPKSDYFYQRWSENFRKMQILSRYKSRSNMGAPLSVMNIEELATVYHFPVSQVKAPLVKKTEAKRAEPPVSLPTREVGRLRPFKKVVPPKPVAPVSEPTEEDESPSNLPFA